MRDESCSLKVLNLKEHTHLTNTAQKVTPTQAQQDSCRCTQPQQPGMARKTGEMVLWYQRQACSGSSHAAKACSG